MGGKREKSGRPGTEVEGLQEEIERLRSRIAELETAPEPSAPPGTSRLFAGLLELPLLFYHVGPDGRFLDVLGRAIERLGIEPSDLIGRPVVDLFPEAETEIAESMGGRALSSETSGSFQGRPWAALSFVTPLEEGGTIGVSLDVTDWKLARQELAASEDRFRSLAETVAVAISRNDPVGNILYANEPMANLLGRPLDEVVGHNSMEFVHEADRERIAREYLEAQGDSGGYAGVFRIETAEGRLPWVLGRSVPELNAAGEVTGIVSSLVDITERKQVEDELNQRVADRTVQLVEANKQLEAFCYSVSHDLRSPLRSIDGFCRLLAEDLGGALTGPARENLERVFAATSRMDRLIDDFLSLSRASLGALTRTQVDLSELARRVAEELQRRAPERSVRFRIEPDLEAHGDPTLLADALENLLGNAFKFTSRTADACIEFFGTGPDTTGPGGEPAAAGTTYVVRDNGAGFDMDQASKLFQAFHRLHGDHEFEGTGVGLATVERIIHRHGGRIWAEAAAPGQGATFKFTIPAP